MDRKAWFLSGTVVLLLSSVLASVSMGQAIDWAADVSDVTLERGPGSVRLQGMGGLLLGIPDEGRELNLHDYGRNLSGLLWDCDASRMDLWYRSSDAVVDLRDAQRTRTRSRSELGESGTTLYWRVNPRRLLGAEAALERLGDQIERSDRSLIRNPAVITFGVQQFGSFVVGGGIGFSQDDQSLRTEDVFGIIHNSSGTRYVGSMAYRRSQIVAGLQIERQSNTITGASHDESHFHEDELTWKRPVGIYSASVVWQPNEVISGALRGEVQRIDAREEAQISWSDRMPDNPGRANFLADVGTFEEKVRRNVFGSRWEARPVEPLCLGAEWESGQETEDVTEGENFKGSRRAEDSKRNWTQFGVGGGYQLADGKLHVGADGWYLRKTDEQGVVGGKSKATGRTVELRAGAEWFVAGSLALRGGFTRTATDSNVDQPRTLLAGNGFALGIGFLPRGGLYQIDAAFRQRSLNPDYQGEPSREESGTAFSLGARFLF
jgi:predicted porin